MTAPAPIDGYARLSSALGIEPPRPKLRVVREDEATSAPARDTGVWRPADLGDYVGQTRAQAKVKMWVHSAIKRGTQPGHTLLTGPPGLGKTSLAAIIAATINAERPEDERVGFHSTTGDAVSSPQQLAKALAKLAEGDVLFIDECHQMGRRSEEMLGLGMEDGRVTVPGSKSGSTESVVMDLPRFTVVGATTRPAHLTQPLRDRFGMAIAMEFYAEDELAEILTRRAARDEIELTADAALAIAGVGRQTPRKTLAAFEMVVAYADTVGAPSVDLTVAHEAFEVMGVDSLGLDERDREYCDVVASWSGRRAGLKPLSSASGLDQKEISDDIEPYLMRAGIIDVTSRGRCLTKRAYRHLYPDRPIPPMLGLS